MIEFENCFLKKLGNEYHYVLEWTYFDDLRKSYLPRELFRRPINTMKFESQLSSSDNHFLYKISNYCKVAENIPGKFQEHMICYSSRIQLLPFWLCKV